jgi:GTP-binding protein Era
MASELESSQQLLPGPDPCGAEPPLRTGFCALLGLPNVGKSTLLNGFLGRRLVAVSPRPQTTRNRILGVRNLQLSDLDHEDPEGATGAQVVLIDTPGVQIGQSPLRRYMQEQALSAAGECDVGVLLVDVTDPRQRAPGALGREDAEALEHALASVRAPVLLGLNKIDRIGKERLLPIIQAYAAQGRFAEIIPLSGLTGDGLPVLARAIVARLPLSPRLFPEEMYTDRAEQFLAAELVREQLFRQLGQEVPYATAVVVEAMEERRDPGDLVIDAVIYVERDSQKAIVVGKGGARIKEVGQRARAAISELFGCPVHLRLHVKVADAWSRAEHGIRRMGYE